MPVKGCLMQRTSSLMTSCKALNVEMIPIPSLGLLKSPRIWSKLVLVFTTMLCCNTNEMLKKIEYYDVKSLQTSNQNKRRKSGKPWWTLTELWNSQTGSQGNHGGH